MSDVNVTVSLTVKTCPCGTVYAIPCWLNGGYQCPTCAYRIYDKLQSRFDGVYMEKCRLERVERGLRGAMKQKTVRR